MNYRKATASPLDQSILTRPDTIQLIQQILMLVQNKVNPRGFMMNQGGMGRGGMRRPMNQGQQHNGGRRHGSQPPVQQPMQPYQQPVAPMAPPTIPAQVAPQQTIVIGGLTPLANPDPYVNDYNMRGCQYIPAVNPQNPNYKNMIGEYIYEYVEKIVGDEKAPKVTGMLIDLPIEEIKQYLYDFSKLHQKAHEAVSVLNQMAMNP